MPYWLKENVILFKNDFEDIDVVENSYDIREIKMSLKKMNEEQI